MKDIKNLFLGAGLLTAMLSACSTSEHSNLTQSGLNPADFDSTVLGKKTELVTLKNANGMEVCLTNYGGRVVSISVPDKDGKPTDVVLGYDNIHQYADTLNSPSDYGSSVGRYANRIRDGRFTLHGRTYQLPRNRPPHCLHGGQTGFDRKLWRVTRHSAETVTFQLFSPDGDQGFPGSLTATAVYAVKESTL